MTVLTRPTRMTTSLPGLLIRLLATVLAGLLFAVGWTAGRTVRSVLWCATAIRLGWGDGRGPGDDR